MQNSAQTRQTDQLRRTGSMALVPQESTTAERQYNFKDNSFPSRAVDGLSAAHRIDEHEESNMDGYRLNDAEMNAESMCSHFKASLIESLRRRGADPVIGGS